MKNVATSLPRKKTENLFSGGKSGAISISDDRPLRLFSAGRRTSDIVASVRHRVVKKRR